MSRRLKPIDYSRLDAVVANLDEALRRGEVEQLMQDCLLEIAYRIEAQAKLLTPVDSGELRRNWRVGEITRAGNEYQIEIVNNTEYASFVEFGHRHGVDLTKWSDGKFMLRTAVETVETQLQAIFDRHVRELHRRIFGG